MQKTIKTLGIFMLVIFTALSFSSCSNDEEDLIKDDAFAGIYKGSVSYKDADKDITTTEGSIFVTKVISDKKYNFAFSNDIPALNEIDVEKTGDKTLVMVGSNATAYVRVDNNEIKIAYTKDGKTWTANCKR